MRIIASLITAHMLCASGVAVAQSASAPAATAEISVGASVFDANGGDVGTIEVISGDAIVVSTGTQKVTLPKAAFAQWPKGLTIGMTRDELNTAAQQAEAKTAEALANALTPGAEVHGSGGTTIGTVKSVETEQVLVATAKGDVTIPTGSFIVDAAGLSIGLSAAQFEQAVAEAQKPGA